MDEPDDDRHLALHEAGHAVAAVAVGLDVRDATIVPGVDDDTGDSYWGRVRLVTDLERWRSLDPAHARSAAVYILAGPEAERRSRGWRDDVGCTRWRGDENRALAWVGPRGEHGAQVAARSFVSEHWTTIEAVAAALLAEGTLSGEQVRAIVERDRR